MISASMVISPLTSYATEATSNDYRATFIGIKRGQSQADIDTNNITAETLRIIALYISNFYTPFYTTLDTEDEYGTKAQIIETLVNTCNFSDDTAEALVELCYQYSLQTIGQHDRSESLIGCNNVCDQEK